MAEKVEFNSKNKAGLIFFIFFIIVIFLNFAKHL